MGKLSKSIKKHIKKNKIKILETEFIGKNLYNDLQNTQNQDQYSDECSQIIKDYEFYCKETNAKNIQNITLYYDTNFKNGIISFRAVLVLNGNQYLI